MATKDQAVLDGLPKLVARTAELAKASQNAVNRRVEMNAWEKDMIGSTCDLIARTRDRIADMTKKD